MQVAYVFLALKIHEAYVGDAYYEPIWAELDERAATVFLHGAQTPSSTPHPHSFLGVPIVEVCTYLQSRTEFEL